jgi:uncharacterized protein YecA (UPF0149 family)
MDTLDIRTAIPFLKQLGIDPSNLSSDKLENIMKLTKNITSHEQITPELTTQMLNILGVGNKPVKKKQPIKRGVKIGRNELCICESGKKYKKCCGSY